MHSSYLQHQCRGLNIAFWDVGFAEISSSTVAASQPFLMCHSYATTDQFRTVQHFSEMLHSNRPPPCTPINDGVFRRSKFISSIGAESLYEVLRGAQFPTIVTSAHGIFPRTASDWLVLGPSVVGYPYYGCYPCHNIKWCLTSDVIYFFRKSFKRYGNSHINNK